MSRADEARDAAERDASDRVDDHPYMTGFTDKPGCHHYNRLPGPLRCGLPAEAHTRTLDEWCAEQDAERA